MKKRTKMKFTEKITSKRKEEKRYTKEEKNIQKKGKTKEEIKNR